MSLAFPLSRAVFWDLLPIREFVLEPSEPQELIRSRGGMVRAARIGQPLFVGRVLLDLLPLSLELQLQPLLGLVGRAGATFTVSDPRRPGPAADPTGATLGGATPTLTASATDTREAQIDGLPSGYVLTQGDALAFEYGAAPVRRGYHRVVQTVTADGSGSVAAVELDPPLRDGVGGPVSLTLVQPSLAVRMIPGSLDLGAKRGGVREGVAFGIEEVIA